MIRARHRVEGLAEHVPNLVGLDIRPSDAIPGPRFGKDARGRTPAIGSQFAGVRADSMWPMPGEAVLAAASRSLEQDNCSGFGPRRTAGHSRRSR